MRAAPFQFDPNYSIEHETRQPTRFRQKLLRNGTSYRKGVFNTMTQLPTYDYERILQEQGCQWIAGVDEVGRGPISGPVFAAAVILDPKHIPIGLNDSKKLSAKKRDALLESILAHADVSVASASEREIEQINILRAAHLAMERAVAGLRQTPDHVLVDGNIIPRNLETPRHGFGQRGLFISVYRSCFNCGKN